MYLQLLLLILAATFLSTASVKSMEMNLQHGQEIMDLNSQWNTQPIANPPALSGERIERKLKRKSSHEQLVPIDKKIKTEHHIGFFTVISSEQKAIQLPLNVAMTSTVIQQSYRETNSIKIRAHATIIEAVFTIISQTDNTGKLSLDAQKELFKFSYLDITQIINLASYLEISSFPFIDCSFLLVQRFLDETKLDIQNMTELAFENIQIYYKNLFPEFIYLQTINYLNQLRDQNRNKAVIPFSSESVYHDPGIYYPVNRVRCETSMNPCAL